eukprot:XP_028354022.1 uncharacterized protein LOC114487595 [Physeter catodon]
MELVANGFVAALLVLLLASRATDAAPRNAAAGPRKAFVPLPAEAEAAQPEEVAGALNEEEDEESRRGALPWYKFRPDIPRGEQRNVEAALSVPNLKKRSEALTAQVLNRIRTSAADGHGSRVRGFLEKLNDPEVRKDLFRVALGAAGITATGLLLGDLYLLRQVGLVSLYIAALYQVFYTGSHLVSKLMSDVSEQASVTRKDKTRRQKLATLFGVRPENEATSRRMDDQ